MRAAHGHLLVRPPCRAERASVPECRAAASGRSDVGDGGERMADRSPWHPCPASARTRMLSERSAVTQDGRACSATMARRNRPPNVGRPNRRTASGNERRLAAEQRSLGTHRPAVAPNSTAPRAACAVVGRAVRELAVSSRGPADRGRAVRNATRAALRGALLDGRRRASRRLPDSAPHARLPAGRRPPPHAAAAHRGAARRGVPPGRF